jgi:hypothetical protein
MRKILLWTVLLLMLTPLCACAADGGQPETPTPAGERVEITFDYVRQSGAASNQFAVWVENADGVLIKTLYATRYTANGGYRQRPDSIPDWVQKSGLASMSQEEVDAASSATPRPGTLTYAWDLTDAGGAAVPPGEYRFFVEGSLRWKNRVLYSCALSLGGDPVTVQAEAAFFREGADGRPALSADAPENAMIGPVTASYVPAEP